jgi:uncharacterized protein (DUF58 family)
MIPTDRFAILLIAAGLIIGFSGRFAPLMPVGAALAALTLVLAAADWLRLARQGKPEVTRTVDDKLSLGAENLVTLRIRNSAYSRLSGAIRDEYPEDFTAKGNVIDIDLAARSETDLTYHVTPPHRGDFEFGDAYLRLRGPLGLLIRQIRYPLAQEVKVYPNLLDLRRYEIGLRKERLMQPGQRVMRIHGRGTDFESLRDYLPDDEFRAIDWKASARTSKLMSRQYQEEKSQNVMILLDCGRVMGPVIDGLSRLDWSVNAAMMLAHVAAIKGDKVGLMAFGEQIQTFSPPRAGRSQTLNLLGLTYNLQSAAGDSDYYRAFPLFSRKWTRRSLVVVFTELVDPEASKPLISQITGLTRKHLCMVVAMADPAVSAAASREPETPEDAFRSATAKQVIHARKLAAAQLVRAGALVLDVLPHQFTPAVVNQYLRVKSAARL